MKLRGFRLPAPGRWLTPAVVMMAVVAVPTAVALVNGPPTGHTGAPRIGAAAAEPSCARSGCHVGNPLNSQGSLELDGVPETYTPGQTYPITVRLASTATAGQAVRRWGFEVTSARLSDGQGAGVWDAGTFRLVTGLNGRQYVTHDAASSFPATPSPAEWPISWTAPAQDEGPIGFFAAGNAANGNGVTTGDFVYTIRDTAQAGTVPVDRSSWGRVKAHPWSRQR